MTDDDREWWHADMADLLAERQRAEAKVARVEELVNDALSGRTYHQDGEDFVRFLGDLRNVLKEKS